MTQEATRKIVTALRCIRDGRIYLSDAVASQMPGRLSAAASGVSAVPASPFGALSDKDWRCCSRSGVG